MCDTLHCSRSRMEIVSTPTRGNIQNVILFSRMLLFVKSLDAEWVLLTIIIYRKTQDLMVIKTLVFRSRKWKFAERY